MNMYERIGKKAKGPWHRGARTGASLWAPSSSPAMVIRSWCGQEIHGFSQRTLPMRWAGTGASPYERLPVGALLIPSDGDPKLVWPGDSWL